MARVNMFCHGGGVRGAVEGTVEDEELRIIDRGDRRENDPS